MKLINQMVSSSPSPARKTSFEFKKKSKIKNPTKWQFNSLKDLLATVLLLQAFWFMRGKIKPYWSLILAQAFQKWW